MDSKTLTSVFESHKVDLADKLTGLSLPKDAKKVQEIVSQFLGNLFESDGVYRQNLTQSEDYILQAAIQLLQTQQTVAKEIVSANHSAPASMPNVDKKDDKSNFIPIIGAGLGAAAGSLIGTWAAVCGAIAGTAVSVYCSYKSTPKKVQVSQEVLPAINVDAFTKIVANICASIDGLMETYRVQVKRIENIYAQKESPSILSQCESLLSHVANVSKVVESNKENVPAKVVNAVEMLVESLENYNLAIENGKVVSLRQS